MSSGVGEGDAAASPVGDTEGAAVGAIVGDGAMFVGVGKVVGLRANNLAVGVGGMAVGVRLPVVGTGETDGDTVTSGDTDGAGTLSASSL